jgi:hypothetical protein
MLLRHRPPRSDPKPPATTKGFEHLDENWIAVLRWLKASRVEFVLVGAAAEAVRGNPDAKGPVAIVPAPYGRNYERVSKALASSHARLRIDATATGEVETMQVKLTAEKLARGQRWTIRCDNHDLDVEGHPSGARSYQELLYEAGRFHLAADVSIDVASPEDIEHYEHVRRTGTSPEIKITRAT